MNKRIQRSGFAHMVIIVVILGVALVGALGFIFYQNFVQKKTDSVAKTETQQSTSNKNSQSESNKSDTGQASIADKDYLTISDWGVRFKIPSETGSKEIKYYKGLASKGDVYLFTTSEVENLGGNCAYSSTDYWVPLATVIKSTQTPQEDESIQGYTGKLVAHLGDVYYYYQSPQSSCSNNNTSLQTEDIAVIRQLVMSLEKS